MFVLISSAWHVRFKLCMWTCFGHEYGIPNGFLCAYTKVCDTNMIVCPVWFDHAHVVRRIVPKILRLRPQLGKWMVTLTGGSYASAKCEDNTN